MRVATVSKQMPVKSQEVFDLLHDYDRRLEWDTLLRKAELTRGHVRAEKGATSLCVGRPLFGMFGMETRYVTYKAGELAAVQLINHPPLFGEFAASIRHEDNAAGSTATYKFRFTAKPTCLRWLLEPLMLVALRAETAKRLNALSHYFCRAKVISPFFHWHQNKGKSTRNLVWGSRNGPHGLRPSGSGAFRLAPPILFVCPSKSTWSTPTKNSDSWK